MGLSETGHLETMYMGTDPSVFTPPQVESRDLNYAAMDAEMASLMRHVKLKSTNNGRRVLFFIKSQNLKTFKKYSSVTFIFYGDLHLEKKINLPYQIDFYKMVIFRLKMFTEKALYGIQVYLEGFFGLFYLLNIIIW